MNKIIQLRFWTLVALLLLASLIGCGRNDDRPVKPDAPTTPQDVVGTVSKPADTASEVNRGKLNGNGAESQGDPFADFPKAPPPLANAFRITLRKDEQGLRTSVSLKLTVENTSHQTLAWDTACSVFAHVTVKDAVSGVAVPSAAESVQGSRNAERFIKLKPGESYTRAISLTDGVTEFAHARMGESGPGGETFVRTIGNEIRRTFNLVAGNREWLVQVEYDSSDPDARDAFSTYFGTRPETLEIPSARSKSESIRIQLPHVK